MTKTSKGYLTALKKVIMELNPYVLNMTYREEEVFYDACRAYATFCEPLIYTDTERLEELREILKRVKERVQNN